MIKKKTPDINIRMYGETYIRLREGADKRSKGKLKKVSIKQHIDDLSKLPIKDLNNAK